LSNTARRVAAAIPALFSIDRNGGL
jgi:hypothetical protein